MIPSIEIPTLQHGRMYALPLGDGTLLPLMAWNETNEPPWQLLEACPGGDLCVHGRHGHLLVQPDGTFEVEGGTEPSRHDPDVRAVAAGLTVRDLRPANRLALALFRVVAGRPFPCSRCGAVVGARHHPACHLENLVPLFPMLDGTSWRVEVGIDLTG